MQNLLGYAREEQQHKMMIFMGSHNILQWA